jgi:hypothetical protein
MSTLLTLISAEVLALTLFLLRQFTPSAPAGQALDVTTPSRAVSVALHPVTVIPLSAEGVEGLPMPEAFTVAHSLA